MLLGIILILVFLMLISLLWMPIVLYINSVTNQYYIQLKGLAKVSIEPHEKEILMLKLKILFFTFHYYPLKKSDRSDKTIEIEKQKTKKRKSRINFQTVLRVLKSFKLKRFLLNIDTGDCILNSKLYPVFACLNFYKDSRLYINYQGRNSVLLYIENKPIRIIKSFINN